MKVIKYLESKLAYPKATLAILVIVLVISMVGLVYSSSRNAKVHKYAAEQSLAMQYDSKIRDSLFNLAIEKGDITALNALDKEIYRTQQAIKARLLLRSKEMSRQWKNHFALNQLNLGTVLDDNNLLMFTNSYFHGLADKSSLTAEEVRVLELIKSTWNKADEFSREHKLERVFIGTSSYSTTRYGRIHSGPWITNIEYFTSDSDLIAEHGYQLIKNLLSIPRTFSIFMGKRGELSEINISEDVLPDQYYSGESVKQFEEMMRNYSFVRVKDQPDFKPLYYINVFQDQDGRMNPFLIEVGSDHIRISKTIHSFPYQRFKDRADLWNEWLYKIQVDGMYESSPELIDDLRDFLQINEGMEK